MAAPGGSTGGFQDVNLAEDSKEKDNENRLVSRESEEHLDIPLTCFDKFKKMIYSKEEWEAYLIEKMEKLHQHRLKSMPESRG